jgi:hypothetical protein
MGEAGDLLNGAAAPLVTVAEMVFLIGVATVAALVLLALFRRPDGNYSYTPSPRKDELS